MRRRLTNAIPIWKYFLKSEGGRYWNWMHPAWEAKPFFATAMTPSTFFSAVRFIRNQGYEGTLYIEPDVGQGDHFHPSDQYGEAIEYATWNKKRVDIHTEKFRQLMGRDPSAEERRNMKAVNLGTLYGSKPSPEALESLYKSWNKPSKPDTKVVQ